MDDEDGEIAAQIRRLARERSWPPEAAAAATGSVDVEGGDGVLFWTQLDRLSSCVGICETKKHGNLSGCHHVSCNMARWGSKTEAGVTEVLKTFESRIHDVAWMKAGRVVRGVGGIGVCVCLKMDVGGFVDHSR